MLQGVCVGFRMELGVCLFQPASVLLCREVRSLSLSLGRSMLFCSCLLGSWVWLSLSQCLTNRHGQSTCDLRASFKALSAFLKALESGALTEQLPRPFPYTLLGRTHPRKPSPFQWKPVQWQPRKTCSILCLQPNNNVEHPPQGQQ